ncbi:SSI family serine proteinase inhibitor [Streptomyces sp. NPDC050535]|uniref:SSI family serine proteinase inhibitor n=1 Tax=Streptomyces sp. NPDC050535 TaxID=3365626 RepID=UPI00378FC3A6
MLRRLVLTVAASAAALSAVSAGPATALPAGPVAPAGSFGSLESIRSFESIRTPVRSLGFFEPVISYAEPAVLGPAQRPGLSTSPPPALLPPPARDEDSRDRLTVTVLGTGNGKDGTYELRCHPGGGTHPDVSGACGALDRGAQWGKDPFAPVPQDAMCTMQYGGPATAHVTGTWAGRPVDARFDRGDGCRIARWNALAPLLPDLRS